MRNDISPLISVVIPAYNAEKTLVAAVDSVLQQTYQNIEVMIVNDCSTDATAQIAQQYAQQDQRVKLLNNPRNSGVSVTRMNGVNAAVGEWIAFLDSDDMWAPEKLEKQIKRQQQTDAQLVFTSSAFVDSQGNRIDWILHVPDKIGYWQLLKQNLISNSSVLIRKEIYQRYAIMGDHMHEDFACWLKFLHDDNFAYGIDEPLLIYRLSPKSKSGNKFVAARMNWNTYRAVGLNPVVAGYYMLWYTVKGVLKYRNLRY